MNANPCVAADTASAANPSQSDILFRATLPAASHEHEPRTKQLDLSPSSELEIVIRLLALLRAVYHTTHRRTVTGGVTVGLPITQPQ